MPSTCGSCPIYPAIVAVLLSLCNMLSIVNLEDTERSSITVRDLVAQVMKEAGHPNVEVEPKLQPLSGEAFDYKSANKDDYARSEVCGFWSKMRQAYFDVKVVSPLARSYAKLSTSQLFNG